MREIIISSYKLIEYCRKLFRKRENDTMWKHEYENRDEKKYKKDTFSKTKIIISNNKITMCFKMSMYVNFNYWQTNA